MFCEGGLVRSFARQQQALSLSSCEARIICFADDDSRVSGLHEVCHRVLFSIGEISEPEVWK